jgi:hypothetical protein
MTETEAKKKICPLREVTQIVATYTLFAMGYKKGDPELNQEHLDSLWFCKASECMMWRWHIPFGVAADPIKRDNGYCGLGGTGGAS